MERIKKSPAYKFISACIAMSLMTTITMAQDNSKTVTSHSTVTTTQTTWYAEPWAWALGAAVLIIIIIALTRGSSGRNGGTVDKVTYTKKVSREDA